MKKYYLEKQKEIMDKKNGPEFFHAQCEIIFCADGLIRQGGLADRLRGLISLYKVCKESNRQFKINFTSPFCLEEFLSPNFYNWTIEPNQISYNDKQSRVVYLVPKAADKSWFDYAFIKNYLSNQLNKNTTQYRVYTNIDLAGYEFGTLYKELFKPSQLLQNAIIQQTCAINGSYVSASFRFLDILGDFKDNIEYSLSKERTNQILKECLDSIDTLVERHPTIDKVLVTSDSQRFLDKVAKHPKVYIVPGEIAHVDYANTSHLKTFLDFYLIAQAKKVYLVRTPEMYPSSYARTAALINSTPFEQLLLS